MYYRQRPRKSKKERERERGGGGGGRERDRQTGRQTDRKRQADVRGHTETDRAKKQPNDWQFLHGS